MDDATVERVRALVRAIPPGQVRSYGEIADEAGLSSARLVGRLLAEDGHDLPWHRVVRADGRFAPHLATEQAARLRVEGVLATDGRVPPPLRPCR
jgi:methylated-DNA-protein-cysteine methyltransferase related protein